jgi:hypothetical protein
VDKSAKVEFYEQEMEQISIGELVLHIAVKVRIIIVSCAVARGSVVHRADPDTESGLLPHH